MGLSAISDYPPNSYYVLLTDSREPKANQVADIVHGVQPNGTVKLTRTARRSPQRLSADARSARARYRIPHPERLPAKQSVVSRP